MDITFAPFLERIVSSIAYYKGFRVRGEVSCKGWWSRCSGGEAQFTKCGRVSGAGAALLCLPSLPVLCTQHCKASSAGLRPCPDATVHFSACCGSSFYRMNPLPLYTPPEQGRWPNLERWFAAMEARPAYAGFKSDHYTHVHDLPPQLGGCVSGRRGPGWLCWM